jgi:hypothetical protein
MLNFSRRAGPRHLRSIMTTAIRTTCALSAALRDQAAATLGVAFWLVAFVLAFFVVYFRGRVRVLQQVQ